MSRIFFIILICGLFLLTVFFNAGILYAQTTGLGSAGSLLEEAGKGAGIDTKNADARVTVGLVINAVVGFVGVVFLGLAVYGGMLWMTAAGNEERVKKGREVIVRAIVGMAIVFLAYAITYFISFYVAGVKF